MGRRHLCASCYGVDFRHVLEKGAKITFKAYRSCYNTWGVKCRVCCYISTWENDIYVQAVTGLILDMYLKRELRYNSKRIGPIINLRGQVQSFLLHCMHLGRRHLCASCYGVDFRHLLEKEAKITFKAYRSYYNTWGVRCRVCCYIYALGKTTFMCKLLRGWF